MLESRRHHPFGHPEARLLANAPWLVKLRWVAVVGQLLTIVIVAWGLQIALPLVPLAVAVAVTAITNVMLAWWLTLTSGAEVEPGQRRVPAAIVMTAVMLLDLIVLTAMLYVTGGASNPFMVFYFVNLALAGVMLQPRLAWFLNAVAVATMAMLYWHHWQLPLLQDPARLKPISQTPRPNLAALGDVVAFVACSAVIVVFMTRLSSQLARSEARRQQADQRRARSEKLEALGTLAAGAAHELATPLSTIAVIATEVERELAQGDLPPEVAADLGLIRSELARCRKILDRMSFDSGQMIGEAAVRTTVGELVEGVIAELANPRRIEVVSTPELSALEFEVPRVSLAQALRGLVQNALDAAPHQSVTLRLNAGHGHLWLHILDQGPGMPPEVLARAGEPFFTPKEPGKGMGLGLFLAVSVVERLGGALELKSQHGAGTEVIVRLPSVGRAELARD